MKVNFKDCILKDLDGNVIGSVSKFLAQSIYNTTKDLSLVDIALMINREEEVELSQGQAEEIKRIVQDEKSGFFSFAQKTILDFLK